MKNLNDDCADRGGCHGKDNAFELARVVFAIAGRG